MTFLEVRAFQALTADKCDGPPTLLWEGLNVWLSRG